MKVVDIVRKIKNIEVGDVLRLIHKCDGKIEYRYVIYAKRKYCAIDLATGLSACSEDSLEELERFYLETNHTWDVEVIPASDVTITLGKKGE